MGEKYLKKTKKQQQQNNQQLPLLKEDRDPAKQADNETILLPLVHE